jgi:hypothetical protein
MLVPSPSSIILQAPDQTPWEVGITASGNLTATSRVGPLRPTATVLLSPSYTWFLGVTTAGNLVATSSYTPLLAKFWTLRDPLGHLWTLSEKDTGEIQATETSWNYFSVPLFQDALISNPPSARLSEFTGAEGRLRPCPRCGGVLQLRADLAVWCTNEAIFIEYDN